MRISRTILEMADLTSFRQQRLLSPCRQNRGREAITGHHLSSYRGSGMDFDEARHYLAGDEIRHMDWRVTARTGKPHTKVFREDRQIRSLFYIDFSASMYFGTQNTFKSVIAAQAAAAFAWRCHSAGETLSEIRSHQEKAFITPAQGSFKNLLLMFQRWINSNNQREICNLSWVDISQAIHRRSHVGAQKWYIFSDFYQQDTLDALLKKLGPRISVTLVCIYDNLEKNLPPPRYYKFAENNEIVALETSSITMRRRFREHFEQHVAQLKDLARRYHSQFILLSTQDDVLQTLKPFLR